MQHLGQLLLVKYFQRSPWPYLCENGKHYDEHVFVVLLLAKYFSKQLDFFSRVKKYFCDLVSRFLLAQTQPLSRKK